jgi:hypothetical protein
MMSVELRPAYAWDCDECGRENFSNGIVAELSNEERDELRIEHGLEEATTGDWMMMPKQVTCVYCGSTFSVLHFHEDESEPNGT